MPGYTSQEIEQFKTQITDTFHANPNRVKAVMDYEHKDANIDRLLNDFAEEIRRINRIYDQHICTVSGESDPEKGMQTIFAKIEEMHQILNGELDDDMEKMANDHDFSDLVQFLKDMKLMMYPQKDRVWQPMKVGVLNAKLDKIGQSIEDIKTRTEKLHITHPEYDALNQQIIAEMQKVKIKNAPGKEKDMLGVPNEGVLAYTAEKFLVPGSLGTELKSMTMDSQMPRDPEGQNVMAQLHESIDAISRKTGSMVTGEGDDPLSGKDFEKFIISVRNVIENGQLFTNDVPNMAAPRINKRTTWQLNPVMTKMLNALDNEKKEHMYPGSEVIEKCLIGYQEAFQNRCKAEYEKQAAIAFSGDVANDQTAKAAWEKMEALKAASPELDAEFRKDRLAMMMINPAFNKAETNRAAKALADIESRGNAATGGEHYKNHENMGGKRFQNEGFADERFLGAQETLMVGIIADRENKLRESEGEKKSDRRKLFTAPSQFLKEVVASKTAEEKREKARTFALQAAAAAANMPEHQSLFDDPALRSFGTPEQLRNEKNEPLPENTPQNVIDENDNRILQMKAKMNELLKSKAKVLREHFGLNPENVNEKVKQANVKKIQTMGPHGKQLIDLSDESLLCLLEKGTPEYTEMKKQLTAMMQKQSNMENLTPTDYRGLFDACVDYLHKKASVPHTTSGKNRVDAAQKLLVNIGMSMMPYLTREEQVAVKNEIKKEMLRNNNCRHESAAHAAYGMIMYTTITEDEKLEHLREIDEQKKTGFEHNAPLSDLRLKAEIAVFAHEADLVLQGKYVDTRLITEKENTAMDKRLAALEPSVKEKTDAILAYGPEGIRKLVDLIQNPKTKTKTQETPDKKLQTQKTKAKETKVNETKVNETKVNETKVNETKAPEKLF